MNPNDHNFSWLNREGRWDGHHWIGLQRDTGGALQLGAVPRFTGDSADVIAALPAPRGPAGVAADVDGSVFFADPDGGCVWRINACDASVGPVPCVGRSGVEPAALNQPRGLLLPARRRALLVADSGNDRLLVFDSATSQLTEVWGRSGGLDGQFIAPWTLAADSANRVYVVDHGNARVQQFNALGDVLPAFWKTLSAAGILGEPVDVAAGNSADASGGIATRIYIVDAKSHSVFVVTPDGQPVRDAGGRPVAFGAGELESPLGIAVAGGMVFVGDNVSRRVFQFDIEHDYAFVGEAVGFRGPVAGLAPGPGGALLVHTGGSLAPVSLTLGEGYRRQGVFWTDALRTPLDKVTWHRLEAMAQVPAPDAHLQLFVHMSDNEADAPAAPVLDPGGANPFTDGRWTPKAADVTDVYIGAKPSRYLWVGAWFSSDGLASASVAQMRVEFDHETYLKYLPAIYRKPGACHDFLLRFLSLFESFNSETEARIAALPALFDARTTPVEYLPWLAGWLAFRLQEDWDEATARRATVEAFARDARRGTADGLRDALKEYAAVDAVIEEPLLHAAWWALPAPVQACGTESTLPLAWQGGAASMLGYTTMLAPAQPQGAVVGASAVLDQSHLLMGDEFGGPLFDDVAFQFSVAVYRAQVNCPAALLRVHAVIEQEKPAHTAYCVRVIEAQMRVGFQARVGIDAVVAGAPATLRLGETPALGVQTTLGGEPAGRIGVPSRVGLTLLG